MKVDVKAPSKDPKPYVRGGLRFPLGRACSFPVAALAAAFIAAAAACSGGGAAPSRDGGAADGGVTDGGVADGGATDGGVADGGATDGGVADGGAADGGAADGGAADGGAADGGAADGGAAPSAILADPSPTVTQAPRPAFGAILAADDGARSFVVESRRDAETGPLGLPWRSRFRLAAYEAGVEVWAHPADPDDTITDVVLHPSGELTFALQRHTTARRAYELVRLRRDGSLVGRTVLEEPATFPTTDFGPADPRPLLRMKGTIVDAFTAGWVRLLADGEGVVAAILSYVDLPPENPMSTRRALALVRYAREGGLYVERWARVVEGVHTADPAAWAYDELRWREQAVRPFLSRDDSTGDLLVARAWNRSRCDANAAVFAEFPAQGCRAAPDVLENERLPLAVTRFTSAGQRVGTRILEPEADAAEHLPFALAARGGRLAVAGAIVRTNPDGTKRTYPNAAGNVDYDGYLALYDASGARVSIRDFNFGRGDVLTALRWTNAGLFAAGAAGWDRHQGGMSISRGADPVFVWLSHAGTESATRVLPLTNGSRHWNLHDLAVREGALLGFGVADAPMTHSADGNRHAERTFGPLRIVLSAPQR